jgi:hypothetical protein
VLDELAGRLAAMRRTQPVRIAIDGVDAAGKTVLGDELAGVIRTRGRAVIRASIDGFHCPRTERRRRGSTSPEAYCRDAFDYAAVRTSLFLPLDRAAIAATAAPRPTSTRSSMVRTRPSSPSSSRRSSIWSSTSKRPKSWASPSWRRCSCRRPRSSNSGHQAIGTGARPSSAAGSDNRSGC